MLDTGAKLRLFLGRTVGLNKILPDEGTLPSLLVLLWKITIPRDWWSIK